MNCTYPNILLGELDILDDNSLLFQLIPDLVEFSAASYRTRLSQGFFLYHAVSKESNNRHRKNAMCQSAQIKAEILRNLLLIHL